MAAFTTMAIIGLASYAAAKTIESKKKSDALKQATAPQPTLLAGGGAVKRGTATAMDGPGTPTPPDTGLAASNAAIAALAAASKQRKRAGSGDSMYLGKPGTSTPPARLQQKTLLGN
jgi:hypothetical protein